MPAKKRAKKSVSSTFSPLKNKYAREARPGQERGAWAEAAALTPELVKAVSAFQEYMDGTGGDPTSIFAAVSLALRVSSAMDRALAIRLFRAEAVKRDAQRRIKELAKRRKGS